MNDKEQEVFSGIAQDHFIGKDVGTGKFDIRHLGPKVLELRPVEIHHKEDGSKTNEPTFLIIMQGTRFIPASVYGQISLKMLNDGPSQIGYKISKINE